MTTPVFIVSSGRSGTAALARLLNTFDGVEMHHEYAVQYIQPTAVKYYHGLMSIKDVIDVLWQTHGAGFYYTESKIWGDCSNKISWLVPALSWMFPQAKWIQVVRDGRKVVSSFYNKLKDECYSDQDVMAGWVDNSIVLAPPPEKKYWWNVSPYDTQFESICWHWKEIHETIEADFEQVDDKRTIRLEDLVADSYILADLLKWLDLEYSPEKFHMLQRPYNVHTPKDTMLTDEQLEKFWNICSATMAHFGYDEEEYEMTYEHPV